MMLITRGKMAIISKSMETDYSKVISNHELTITPRCLMDRTRFLYSGYKGKSKLLPLLKTSASITASISLSEVYCWYVTLIAQDRTDKIRC